MEPAIDTTWPDLDSYSINSFRDSLDKLNASDDPKPAVIVGKLDDVMLDNPNIKAKNEMLLDYIEKHDYNIIFESENFVVYSAQNESEE